MRIKTEVSTETNTHVTDSGTLTIIPGEQVVLGKSVFHVQRTQWVPTDDRYDASFETQLIGVRGSLYNLVPVHNHKGEHFGEYLVVSTGTGQPMRKQGNTVRVIELGGIIEVKA